MAEIAATVVGPIAEKTTGYAINQIVRQVGYLVHYKSNLDEFKKQLKKLTDRKDSIQHAVDEAKRNGKEIEPAVLNWFGKVDDFTEQVNDFFAQDQKRKDTTCSCPNLRSRYKLSRRAKKMTQEIVELNQESRFEKIGRTIPLRGVGTTMVKGYHEFESRMPIIKDILEALTDAHTTMIGVHGMGGVGKTMLVKEVARQAREGKYFDEVVMATITQTPNMKKIQLEISEPLGLKIKERTNIARADRVRERLKAEKTVLVILDDLWANIDLEEVGIPVGEDHKGCKILMTSRKHDVLSNEMDTQKNFLVEELSKEESWNFFNKIMPNIESNEVKEIASKVSEECSGLPLALAAVANTLKGKDLPIWNDALQQLKNNEMNESVYSSLKLSYKSLKSEEARSIFLLCSLFPEDYQINIKYLLVYAMGMRLLHGVDDLPMARDRILSLVRNLKDSCLLLDGINNDFVKMHDVVRDLAILIASKNQSKYLVKHGVNGQNGWPKTDTVIEYTAISLGCGEHFELPEESTCPKLKFLLLVGTRSHLKIPDNFFEGMKEVTVLDLTGLSILHNIPSSIRGLQNLHTLCIDDCVLPDLAIIGELKKLEILSFRASDIEELPSVIGQLTHLKMLNLTDCSRLRVIPQNLISGLTELSELYMDNSFSAWNEGSSNVGITELDNLSNLTTLHVHIPNAMILPKESIFKGLKSYRILIGPNWDWSGKYETFTRTLKLKLDRSLQKEYGIQALLKTVEDLHLDELKGVKSLVSSLDPNEGFPNLKQLCVQSSGEILSIIDSVQLEHHAPIVFPLMESISLRNLMNLEVICNGRISGGSFRNLKKVNVERCNRLRFVFSSCMARGLPELQELQISECSTLKEIVVAKRDEEALTEDSSDGIFDVTKKWIEFPQLRSLILKQLPALQAFYAPIPENQHGFHPLFNQGISFPSLLTLKLSALNLGKIWEESYEFPTSLSSISQNLTSLTVEDCANLKYLFPINTAKSLVHLKRLEISNCQLMQDIILMPHDQDHQEATIFPNLKRVSASHMDSLERIWGSHVGQESFTKLKTVDIRFCKRLRTVFPSHMLLHHKLVSLETLTVTDCVSVEEIFQVAPHGMVSRKEVVPQTGHLRQLNLIRLPKLKQIWSQDPEGLLLSFPNLHVVNAIRCQSLINLFPKSVGKCLGKLEELKVQFCGVEEIICNEEEVEEEITFVLSKLVEVFLWNLFELKSFYLGKHSLKCPNLRTLDYRLCPNVTISRPQDSDYVIISHDQLHHRSQEQPSRISNHEEGERFEVPKLPKILLPSSQQTSPRNNYESGPSSTEPNDEAAKKSKTQDELSAIKSQLADLVEGQSQLKDEVAKIVSLTNASYDMIRNMYEAQVGHKDL